MFQPLGNTTILPAAGWHPEPKTRGTFSILSSCLITMSLCIWTSLHLNLPEHKKEHLHKYRKLGWMILGLIAPEMVVWNAWEQRKKMKKVSNMMQEKGFMPIGPSSWVRVRNVFSEMWLWVQTRLLLKAKELPEFVEPAPYRQFNGRIHPWTDVQSWFVVMGGMSFEDSAEEDQQFMPGKRRRANITVEGFEYMLKMRDHLIPDISREHIQDKSKSDRLAKLLTCWQAGYFCIQCIFRISQQLSITLLELNVFAHAVCALALLVIWSDKPRDVFEPTLIVGEEAMDICAILCLHAVGGDSKYLRGYSITTVPRWRGSALEIDHPTTFAFHHSSGHQLHYGSLRNFRSLKVLETCWVLVCREMPLYSNFIVKLDARDFRRLQRVSRLIQREESRSHTLQPMYNRSDPYESTYTPDSPEPTCIQPDNMPDVDSSRSIARTKNWSLDLDSALTFMEELVEKEGLRTHRISHLAWLAAGVTFAGACYGGLHLVAWNSPFASRAESLLWCSASASITAAGPFCVLLVVLFRTFRDGEFGIFSRLFSQFGRLCGGGGARKTSKKSSRPSFIHKARVLVEVPWLAMNSFTFFSVLWYVFCRVFIIVESFIMLAHIPEQALMVPTWSAYVPHIV